MEGLSESTRLRFRAEVRAEDATVQSKLSGPVIGVNLGALVVRIGLWGPLCYNYNKESPKKYQQCW